VQAYSCKLKFMLCLSVSMVVAADFPTKLVVIIVDVSPRGSFDMQSRAFASVAEKLEHNIKLMPCSIGCSSKKL